MEKELAKASKALSTSSSSSTVDDEQCSKLRLAVLEKYCDIALSDPPFSDIKDIPQKMWRTCFYARITELRTAATKAKKVLAKAKSSKASNSGSRAEAEERVKEATIAYNQFLTQAIAFYDYVVDCMEKSNVFCSSSSPSSSSSLSPTPTPLSPASKVAHFPHVVNSLHRFYISLGDLHRYNAQEQPGANGKPNFGPSQKNYEKAILLIPSGGNPYNQLAVLEQTKEHEAVAVYLYCRSLMVAEPFETGRSNLDRVLANVKKKIDASNGDSSSVQGMDLRAKFLQMIINLQGLLYFAKVGPLEFEHEMDRTLEVTSRMLRETSLADITMTKMVSGEWSLRKANA